MQIDAHHHFWQPTRGDYGWMPEDNDILNRAYGPVDIAPHLAACRHRRDYSGSGGAQHL